MKYLNISFRASDLTSDLTARSDPRSSVHAIAQRDLARYYAMLARAVRRVHLSEGEWSLILDALNGSLMQPESIPLLPDDIADAIACDHLAEKWGVDGAALVEKLRGFSPDQHTAIVDAAERAWTLPDPTPIAERLRAVGIVR